MLNRNLTASVIAFVLLVVIMSAQNRQLPEGARPYSPTRLQWLAVDMEARMGQKLSMDDGFSIDFVGLDTENTILLYVRYLPSVDREILNGSIETAKKVISVTAKSEGWSSWLKVREDVKMVEEKAK
jgi:hypothetical protein